MLDPEGGWTEHTIELALWSHVTAMKIDPSLVQGQTKRKLEEITEHSASSSMNEVKENVKKVKHVS